MTEPREERHAVATARDALREDQAALLAALLTGAATPPGFDPDRLAAQAGALVARRAAYGRQPPVDEAGRWSWARRIRR